MKQTRVSLDDLLARPGRVIGTWSQFADADVIDILGAAGYAFTIIDCEHGAFGIETAAHLIRACDAAGLLPFVRVPRDDPGAIGKALDAGARAVLVPSVESAEQARRAIAAARFAPDGMRGACPIVRAADHSLADWRAVEAQQASTGVIAMIETRAGVDQCDAICAEPGLKGLMLGPFDLSVSLGLHGDHRDERVQRALAHVLAAARANALPVFVPVFAPERDALATQLAEWSARGVRHFAIGADKIVMAHALRQYREWAEDRPAD